MAMKDKRTFQNTILPLLEADYIYDEFQNPIQFLKSVTPSKELKKAIREAENILDAYNVNMTQSEELYKIYTKLDTKDLDHESQRYLSKIIEDAKRGGIELPKDKKDQLMQLAKDMKEITKKIEDGKRDLHVKVEIEESKLEGMKPEKIEKLASKADGFKILTEKEIGAASQVKDEATREKISLEIGKLGLETSVPLV